MKEKIAEWTQIKHWLEKAKAQEMTLRQEIAAGLFPKEANGAFAEGTQKIEAEGFKAKLTAKMNRTILEEVEAATLAELGAEGMDLIRRKPELSVSAYKKLSDEKRAIADKMLLVKPGAIELEIIPIPA